MKLHFTPRDFTSLLGTSLHSSGPNFQNAFFFDIGTCTKKRDNTAYGITLVMEIMCTSCILYNDISFML